MTSIARVRYVWLSSSASAFESLPIARSNSASLIALSSVFFSFSSSSRAPSGRVQASGLSSSSATAVTPMRHKFAIVATSAR